VVGKIAASHKGGCWREWSSVSRAARIASHVAHGRHGQRCPLQAMSSSFKKTESIPSSIHSLCEAAIFPTTSPSSSGSLTLRSLDQCLHPRQDGTYATAFKEQGSFYCSSTQVPIDRITPLLSLASFKKTHSHFEAVVNPHTCHRGERTLDNEIRATTPRGSSFSSGNSIDSNSDLQYRRLIFQQHSVRPYKFPAKRRSGGATQKMRHISIFQVDKISTTLQLEEYIVKSQDGALLEEYQESMSLLISKTSRHRQGIPSYACK